MQSPLQKMQQSLSSGETTSLQLVLDAMDRIARLDREGPALGAVLEINPQAEGIARAMDEQRRGGAECGPLHGIPVLLKDNIDTGDGMHTSAGALALQNRYAPRDAFIVSRLRAAGAVLLGKTNMTEFANYMADGMPNGYSSRGGQVKNPWGDFDPSGSSTGSAVAVAAGYTAVAIGTETAGSIISPACEAGIVGIKPTVGLVSRSGILPISISQDTAGPMGKSVLDCAATLDVLCGPDPNDPYTCRMDSQPDTYADAVLRPANALAGMTVGICMVDPDEKPIENAKAFESAIAALTAFGMRVVEVSLPKTSWKDMGVVFRNEFRACMDFALRDSVGSPRTLAEVSAYHLMHAGSCLRYGQAHIDRALKADAGMENPAYLRARVSIHRHYTRRLDALFAEHDLSAVATPIPTAFCIAGYPSVTLPVGMVDGQPAPLVLSGLAFSERTLLHIAGTVERAVGPGPSPRLEG